MSDSYEICVALIDEGVDVWKPVRAEHIQANVYRIADQPYDREVETWQFEPGETVECEWTDLADGRFLVATKGAENH